MFLKLRELAQTYCPMKRVLTSFCLILLSLSLHAQEKLEITIGAGYTAIDLDKLILEDEIANTRLDDWDQTNYLVSVQYYFTEIGDITFGIEAAYHYLYWYQVRVPFGPSPIIRAYDVSAFRLAPMFRFGGENANLDLGPTFNFSDDFNPGIVISGNKFFPVSNKIDIPVKLRLDIASGIVIYSPISLSAGIRVKL
jgi:hypothetical protein